MKQQIVHLYFIIIYILGGIFYGLFFYRLMERLQVFPDFVYYVLIIFYLLWGIALYYKQEKMACVIYFAWLITLLFSRTSKSGYNFDFYLNDWLPYLFKNETVTVNVLGNIVLFIPLGFFLRKKIWMGILLIIALEAMQYVMHTGLFDIVDILLNIIGFVTGFVGVKIWEKRKKKKN